MEKRERGFAADMKRLIHLLNMEQSHDECTDTTCQQECENIESKFCNTIEISETESSSLLSRQPQQQQHESELPMIVFPRFPTNTNPVKMGRMLRMIAIYMSEMMDSVKGRIADQYENVISPEAPSEQTAVDYLLQHALKSSSTTEGADNFSGLVDGDEVMINLIDTGTDECKKVEDDMSKFYSQRNAMDFCVESPLLKLFAPDGLHPSDIGYDYFGQFLAKEVMKQW